MTIVLYPPGVWWRDGGEEVGVVLHGWSTHWRVCWSGRTALSVLVVAVVAGIVAMHVTMHAPLLGALGAPAGSSGDNASMHPASSTTTPAATTDPAPASAPVSTRSELLAPLDGPDAVPVSTGDEPCHLDATGHGQRGSTHAAGCDLSAPPLGGASMPGAAALVAVVVLALFVFSAGSAPRGGWQRRGPPAGDRLRLSLCVIRV